MPCRNIYDARSDYREKILPKGISKRIAVEAAHSDYWLKFVGLQGVVIGMQDLANLHQQVNYIIILILHTIELNLL